MATPEYLLFFIFKFRNKWECSAGCEGLSLFQNLRVGLEDGPPPLAAGNAEDTALYSVMPAETLILFTLCHGHLGRGRHGRDALATSRDIKGGALG